MKVAEHIKKAAEALADMVADGHLRDDFELAEAVYLAQYGLQEAKKLSSETGTKDGTDKNN